MLWTTPRFCASCGHELSHDEEKYPRSCDSCNALIHNGPHILVVCLVFAEDKLLLMKRGQPPYAGTWAPPGGFVDANETLQGAAAREVEEEVGVLIDPSRLIPHGIGSEPTLNQIYCAFTCNIDRMLPLQPTAPEASDARWFGVDEYQKVEMWAPAERFDYMELFKQMRSKNFFFYQWTGGDVRMFGPQFSKW